MSYSTSQSQGYYGPDSQGVGEGGGSGPGNPQIYPTTNSYGAFNLPLAQSKEYQTLGFPLVFASLPVSTPIGLPLVAYFPEPQLQYDTPAGLPLVFSLLTV